LRATGGNPAKAAKDLENAKKREEKYKKDLEESHAKLAELEKEHKKMVRPRARPTLNLDLQTLDPRP
jgi:hypothetical protein